MVVGAVADLEYDGIALVAADEIVHDVFEVIDVIGHFAGLFDAVGVLVKTPGEHGGGIGHGKIELDMVTGVIPAAVDLVDGGGIGTPFDAVPVRKVAGLLAFVEEQGFLQGFGVIGIGSGCSQCGLRKAAGGRCQHRGSQNGAEDAADGSLHRENSSLDGRHLRQGACCIYAQLYAESILP